ncbi:uncharacterized protein CXorf65 homolog [Patagioenas fasciata]|uniref:uncharacterized protein CXorf65 homolog n=1 Tax=Patagioenas fasciata TaxID=372321 RepID=UPI0032E88053
MFIHIKHGGESPPSHPVGCCSPGMGGKHHGLAGLSLCGCYQGRQLPSAVAALPADDQHFVANTDCAVLRLLSYVRRMVGVPDTDIIDLCDELGTPKLLFQVTSLSERASDFLQPHGTYYLCRVEFKVPGSEEDRTTWSFTPLLENPSSALTEGLRLQGERRQRRAARRMAEDRRTPDTETLTSTAQSQGEVRGFQWTPG